MTLRLPPNRRRRFLAAAVLLAAALPAPAARAFSSRGDIPSVEMAVFHDERYPLSWMTRGAAGDLAEFCKALGATPLTGDDIATWTLRQARTGSAPRSVLVFAADALPVELTGRIPSASGPLMQFLRDGGTAVWMGDVPFYYIGTDRGERLEWGAQGGALAAGFNALGDWKTLGPAEIAGEGLARGLSRPWESLRAVNPKATDLTLARNVNGDASAWIKRYAPSGKGGFVRLWDGKIDAFDDAMAGDLFRFLKHDFPELETREMTGSLDPVPEDGFLPVLRVKKGRMTKDFSLSAFSAAEEERALLIRISRGRDILGELEIDRGANHFHRATVAVPILHWSQRLQLIFRFDDREAALASFHLHTDETVFAVRAETIPAVNPVDLGSALVPADVLLVSAGQSARIEVEALHVGPERSDIDVFLKFQGRQAFPLDEKKEVLALEPSRPTRALFDLSLEGLAPGTYPVNLEIKEGGKTIRADAWRLVVKATPAERPAFGARLDNLTYEGDVHSFDRRNGEWTRTDWESAWPAGDERRDVVVSFPNGARFVLWRGAGYVPFWATKGNAGLTYEWLEAAYGQGGLTDCIEPLQDKECRFNKAEILASGPARAVVRWSYPLIDLDYRQLDGERAEETFYLYPDGSGTRNLKGWIAPGQWHEANEFIILTPAGKNPFEVLPDRPVNILHPDKLEAEPAFWPRPHASWPVGEPAIFRIFPDRTDRNAPFMVARDFSHFIQLYDGWRINGRYVSPSYWGDHWPVTRGKPTTTEPPDGWRERPGHASLMALESKPDRRLPVSASLEQVEWAWLIGCNDWGDEALRSLARSWLRPGEIIEEEGAMDNGYDPEERAYRLTRMPGARKIAFTLNPEGAAVNPAFVVEGWPADDAEWTLDGAVPDAGEAATGFEGLGPSRKLVLFLSRTLEKPVRIEIRPTDSGGGATQ